MRRIAFALFALALSSVAPARADFAVPPPAPSPPPSPPSKSKVALAVNQPWHGTIPIDLAKHLPRTTRDKAPTGALATVYWGVITTDAVWQKLAQNPTLAALGPIDFRKEAVVFVVNENSGGCADVNTTPPTPAADRGWRLPVTATPATHDIAHTYYPLVLLRVDRSQVARVSIEAGGGTLGFVTLK